MWLTLIGTMGYDLNFLFVSPITGPVFRRTRIGAGVIGGRQPYAVRPQGIEAKLTPAEMSRNLCEQALSVVAADLNLAPIEARPDVWGVLMETGCPGATATVVALADGSVSLYISSGGGVIGAGEHPPVREAAEKLLTITETHIAEFESATQTPLPKTGRVRFYIRTFTATLTAEADEQDLGHHRHKLSPVFHAGHDVITEMRLVSEQRKGSPQ